MTMEAHAHVDLDSLATALYVGIDDELKASPRLNRQRPKVGITPKITDAELTTVSVLQGAAGLPRREPLGPLRLARACVTCSRTCPSSRATTSGCASGDYGCIWSPPCTGYPWRSP